LETRVSSLATKPLLQRMMGSEMRAWSDVRLYKLYNVFYFQMKLLIETRDIIHIVNSRMQRTDANCIMFFSFK
jgi:hypothetical protein